MKEQYPENSWIRFATASASSITLSAPRKPAQAKRSERSVRHNYTESVILLHFGILDGIHLVRPGVALKSPAGSASQSLAPRRFLSLDSVLQTARKSINFRR